MRTSLVEGFGGDHWHRALALRLGRVVLYSTFPPADYFLAMEDRPWGITLLLLEETARSLGFFTRPGNDLCLLAGKDGEVHVGR